MDRPGTSVGLRLSSSRALASLQRRSGAQGPAAMRAAGRSGGRLDGVQALEVLRLSFPQFAKRQPWPDLARRRDVKIRRYVGTYSAVVQTDGVRALAQSMLPLRVRDRDGDLKATDTTLIAQGQRLAPRNTPSRYSLPGRVTSSGSVASFPAAGFGLRTNIDPGVAAPAVRDGRQVSASVQQDQDLVLTPMPTGIDVAWQLRGHASGRLSLEIPGADRLEIERRGDIRAGARIIRHGEGVGRVLAPSATDAAGKPVNVDWDVDGATMRLNVDNQAPGVTAPVLVDPFVTDDQRFWVSNTNLDFNGWVSSGDPNFIARFSGNSIFGNGLYLGRVANRTVTAPAGLAGEWSFKARQVPGAFANEGGRIFKADFGNRADAVSGTSNACWSEGIRANTGSYNVARVRLGVPPNGNLNDPANYLASPLLLCQNEGTVGQPLTYPYRVHCMTICDLQGGGLGNSTPGNQVVLGILARQGTTSGAFVFMGSSLIFQTETFAPRNQLTGLPPGGGWVDDIPISAQADDYGMGMASLTATAPGWTGSTVPTPSCITGAPNPPQGGTPGSSNRGDRNNSCAQNMRTDFRTAALAEGAYNVHIKSQDIVSNPFTETDHPVKIDHNPPTVATTLPHSGQFVMDTDTISISATDQFSGVRSLSYSIDAGAPSPPKTCASDGCALSDSYRIDSTTLRSGTHSIRVTASDGAGHTKTSTTPFTVDYRAPQVSVAGELATLSTATSQSLTEDSYELNADADDDAPLEAENTDAGDAQPIDRPGPSAGTRDIVVRIDDIVVTTGARSCLSNDNTCDQARTFNWNTAGAPNGRHSISVTATDNAGNQEQQKWSVDVQRQPDEAARANTTLRRRIVGASLGDRAGTSAAALGDITGDGYADYVVGAPGVTADGRTSAGAAYIVAGTQNAETIDLATANTSVHRLLGSAASGYCGAAVANAGDMNGDGINDILVGCPGTDPSGIGSLTTTTGKAFIVFGRSDPQDVDLNAVGNAGFAITGPTDPASLGLPLLSARPAVFGQRLQNAPISIDGSSNATQDVNGDNLADIVIGDSAVARGSSNAAGAAYVIYGKTTTEPESAASLGSSGFVIRGDFASGLTGYSAAVVDDVDGDALSDVVVGSPGASPNIALPGSTSVGGRAHIVYGAETNSGTPVPGDVDLASPADRAITLSSGVTGDRFGVTVASLGDTDLDGNADIVVGTRSGAYVLRKAPSQNGTITAADGYHVTGPDNDPGLGSYVPEAPLAPAGDIDGDQRADLIIGYPDASSGAKAYSVISPQRTRDINVAALPGQRGAADDVGNTGGRIGAAVSANSYQGTTPVSENAQAIIGAPTATKQLLQLNAGAAYVLADRTPAGPGPAPDPPDPQDPQAPTGTQSRAAAGPVPAQYVTNKPWATIRNEHGQFVMGNITDGSIFNVQKAFYDEDDHSQDWLWGRLYRTYKGCGWVEFDAIDLFKSDQVGDGCGPPYIPPRRYSKLMNCDYCAEGSSVAVLTIWDQNGVSMPNDGIPLYRNVFQGLPGQPKEKAHDEIGRIPLRTGGVPTRIRWRYITKGGNYVLISGLTKGDAPFANNLWAFVKRKYLPDRSGPGGLCDNSGTPTRTHYAVPRRPTGNPDPNDPTPPDTNPRKKREFWPKVCQIGGYNVPAPPG